MKSSTEFANINKRLVHYFNPSITLDTGLSKIDVTEQKGRLINICGVPGTGKTTLGYSCFRLLQKNNISALFLDRDILFTSKRIHLKHMVPFIEFSIDSGITIIVSGQIEAYTRNDISRILLQCPMDICYRRKKILYIKNNINFDERVNELNRQTYDLTIGTHDRSIEECSTEIYNHIIHSCLKTKDAL